MLRSLFLLVVVTLAGACLETPPFQCEKNPAACPNAGSDAGLPDGNPPEPNRLHSVCARGGRLDRTGDACVSAVCDRMPSCCTGSWGSLCIQLAQLKSDVCKATCNELVAFAGPGQVQVHERSADTWTPAGQFTDTDSFEALSFADVDHDQKTDLVAAAGYTTLDPTPATLLFHHAGTALERTTTELPSFNALDVAWGDIDGNGTVDVALSGGSSTLVLTQTRNAFSPVPIFPNNDALGHSSDLADYDGDGRDELLLTFYEEKVVVVLALVSRDGKPTMQIQKTITLPSDGGKPWRAAWGDADGDTDLDVLVSGDRFVRVYENLTIDDAAPKKGEFAAQPLVDNVLPDIAGDAAWIDYDADGDFDIVTIGFAGGPLRLFLNKGGFAKVADWVMPEEQSSQSIAVGDVDGDHKIDLVVANFHDGSLKPPSKIWRNTGGAQDKFTDVKSFDLDARYVDLGDRP